MKDLILLVADKNAQFALKGALRRPQALGIRPIECEFIVHVGRDGGTRKSGADMLALERNRFRHALLVLDFEGCGTDHPNAAALEQELDQRLSIRWGAEAKSIVIEPELDAWMWGSDDALRQVLEWTSERGIREWLREKDFVFDDYQKPRRPKEALERILRTLRLPRSSSLYESIAERISLRRCSDSAFDRLRTQLRQWFPADAHEG